MLLTINFICGMHKINLYIMNGVTTMKTTFCHHFMNMKTWLTQTRISISYQKTILP